MIRGCTVCGQLMVSQWVFNEWSVHISGWSVGVCGKPGGGLHSFSAHFLIITAALRGGYVIVGICLSVS